MPTPITPSPTTPITPSISCDYEAHIANYVRYMDEITNMIANSTGNCDDSLVSEATFVALALHQIADGGATFHYHCDQTGSKETFDIDLDLSEITFECQNTSISIHFGYHNGHTNVSDASIQECISAHHSEHFSAETGESVAVTFAFKPTEPGTKRRLGWIEDRVHQVYLSAQYTTRHLHDCQNGPHCDPDLWAPLTTAKAQTIAGAWVGPRASTRDDALFCYQYFQQRIQLYDEGVRMFGFDGRCYNSANRVTNPAAIEFYPV